MGSFERPPETKQYTLLASSLKPIIIQSSLCHKNDWPQLTIVETLESEYIKSKWRKMLFVTEIIYKNTKKCTKLTSNYTQQKNNTL